MPRLLNATTRFSAALWLTLSACAAHPASPKAPAELPKAPITAWSAPTAGPVQSASPKPADDSQRKRSGPVALGEKVPLDIEAVEPVAVPGAAPSVDHPRGTLYFAWRSAEADFGIYLGEWGISEGVFLSKKKLRDCPPLCDLHLTRAGQSVVLVEHVEDDLSVEVFDATLTSRARVHLERSPSGVHEPVVDADDRFIVVGKWVTAPPVKAPVAVDPLLVQATEALSVHVVDVKTWKTVGSRVFRGDHLLIPFGPWRRHRPLRIDTQKGSAWAFVGLPEERRAIVQRVSLPSLKTEAERVIPNLDLTRASVDLEPLGSRGVLVTSLSGYTTLSSKLVPSGEAPPRVAQHLVFDASRGSLFAETEAPRKIGAIPVVAAPEEPAGGTPILAFGQHIVLELSEGGHLTLISGEPQRSL